MAALQAKQGGGAGATPGGGMPPSPGAGGGSDIGQQYAQQVSELRGADPGGLARQLKAMKQILSIMLVQNLERLPNVSGQIAKLIPMFDRVLKEVSQAGNVNSAVGGGSRSIQMGAANPPSPQPGGGTTPPGM